MIAAICDLSSLHPDVVAEDVERTLALFSEFELVVWQP
jgi:hypothetical protein